MGAKRLPKPRLKHQEQERRGQGLGMEFMERDVSRRRSDEHRGAEKQSRFRIETEAFRDVECHRAHRGQGEILHRHQEHGVAEKEKSGAIKSTIGSTWLPRSGTPITEPSNRPWMSCHRPWT